MMVVNKLERLVGAPFHIDRRQALVLLIVLTIFAGVLYLRLSVTLEHELPLGRDGPYHLFHVGYLLDHYPSDPFLSSPPVFFHFAAWVCALLSTFGASLMTSFNIVTALVSGLIALTTFLMVRRLTKNDATALVAAFFSAFIPASLRMMGELQKNALGVTLTPLAVLFLWRGLESGRKLDFIVAGIALGVVGLTHELAFGTLVIAYISYLAVLLAYRRRIPWRELKAIVIIAIPAALICGAFYIGKLGAIEGMAGEKHPGPPPDEGQEAILMIQGEQQPPEDRQPRDIYRLYDEYIGQLLLIFAALGAGVAAYRRRATDLFLLAWGMSALIMAQPWVVHGYQWRFVLMLATPMVLLAAVGLVEGIGGLLWRAGRNLRALLGGAGQGTHKAITTAGRVGFLCLLLFVVVHQAHASHTYAWHGAMLRPTITMDEYNALEEFHDQVGDAYAFVGGRFIYWPDAVGLKGKIQGGEMIVHLSRALGAPPGQQPRPMWLATKWYSSQQQVGEDIYAIVSMEEPRGVQVLENEELFVLVFSHPSLRAYALREDFSPPGGHPLYGSGDGISAAEQPASWEQQPSEDQPKGPPPKTGGEEPLVLRILLAPVYATSGSARFMIGVPLTVLLWVLLPCLGWEAIRKITPREKLEKPRRAIIIGGVVLLVLAVVLTV